MIKKETEESIKAKFSENIKSIRNLIKGHFRKSIDELKEKMKLFSKNLKYEKAQEVKRNWISYIIIKLSQQLLILK